MGLPARVRAGSRHRYDEGQRQDGPGGSDLDAAKIRTRQTAQDQGGLKFKRSAGDGFVPRFFLSLNLNLSLKLKRKIKIKKPPFTHHASRTTHHAPRTTPHCFSI